MEKIKQMEEQLASMIQTQLCNPEKADAKELGEVADILKDLAEFCYYKTITDAMEESSKEQKGGNTYYYTVPTMPYDDYSRGRMYYGGGQNNGSSGRGSGGNYSSSGGNMRMYTPSRINPVYYNSDMYREYEYMPDYMAPEDPREGRAKRSRRMYMESKAMHKDSGTQMRELEQYIQDLGEDITEMITNATPEEKQVLQQKIATLSTKIK